MVACLSFLVTAWLDQAKEKAFDALQRGTSQASVVKTFGTPSEIDGPPRNIAWVTEDSIQTNGGECVREFQYHSRLTLCGTEWLIGFDAHSNTVSKYEMSSP